MAAYRDKDMILKLRIECVRGHYLNEPCIRVIEIDENMDLLDLHEAIQDAVHWRRTEKGRGFLWILNRFSARVSRPLDSAVLL